jgi:hypothetical protein
VEIAENPVARSDHRRALPVDENPECFAIAGEDAADDGSVVGGDIRR